MWTWGSEPLNQARWPLSSSNIMKVSCLFSSSCAESLWFLSYIHKAKPKTSKRKDRLSLCNKLGMAVCAFNPDAQEREADGSLWVWGQPAQHRVPGRPEQRSERTYIKTKQDSKQANNNKNPASASMSLCNKLCSFPQNRTRYQMVPSLNFSTARVQPGSDIDEFFKDVSVFARWTALLACVRQ